MIADTTSIAVLQITSGTDLNGNVATIVDAIERAAAGGATMLFTPEMALLLDRDRARATKTVESDAMGRALGTLAAAAMAHRIWLHLGSAPIADPAHTPRWVNRSLLIDADGAIVAQYDKLHLFDVQLATGETWRESNSYAPGNAIVTAETPLGRLGLTICYDLRFGALYDRLGTMGCTAIAIPAAFTVPTGEAHWHVLHRARAIEQGCFIIAPAQAGHHPDGRQTYGHSLVVDPWGTVLLDMGPDPGLAFVVIDTSAVTRVRAQLPTIAHRRAIPE